MKLCDSTYVTVLAGDDYWIDPEKIEKQITYLNTHDDYIAVSCNVINVDESGKLLHKDPLLHRYRSPWIFTWEHAKRYERPNQMSCILYRNFMNKWSNEEVDEYLKCRINGDMKNAAVLGALGKVYVSDEVMAAHRRVFTGGSSWTAWTLWRPESRSLPRSGSWSLRPLTW